MAEDKGRVGLDKEVWLGQPDQHNQVSQDDQHNQVTQDRLKALQAKVELVARLPLEMPSPLVVPRVAGKEKSMISQSTSSSTTNVKPGSLQAIRNASNKRAMPRLDNTGQRFVRPDTQHAMSECHLDGSAWHKHVGEGHFAESDAQNFAGEFHHTETAANKFKGEDHNAMQDVHNFAGEDGHTETVVGEGSSSYGNSPDTMCFPPMSSCTQQCSALQASVEKFRQLPLGTLHSSANFSSPFSPNFVVDCVALLGTPELEKLMPDQPRSPQYNHSDDRQAVVASPQNVLILHGISHRASERMRSPNGSNNYSASGWTERF
mmetsp:Transcript_47825/g.79152  ORF Transcript_47825/g.79152 Transcript_47825/m.79152 type:complete len:319 (-) Transcript_47825:401-1357(-)|eukprot:CAMPEP_0119298596 /NCGR_PEP_ID=MMETSP1333-20130426/758_1 /TAXON_ID=418940 /ORGANISM="Scyphosphaera apsteinii, Strain RCC1455" /LENGTH=318 /DNA_ID=CAMNT_0007299743 /DNA_START=141 /DNA_END=1097 /DNA_ORIENTATION=+